MKNRWVKRVLLSFLILFGFFAIMNLNSERSKASSEMITVKEGDWSKENASLIFTVSPELEIDYTTVLLHHSTKFLSEEELYVCSPTNCTSSSDSKNGNQTYTFNILDKVDTNSVVYYYLLFKDASDNDVASLYGCINITRVDKEAPIVISPTPDKKNLKVKTLDKIIISHSYKKSGEEDVDLVSPIHSITFTENGGTAVSVGFSKKYLYDGKGKATGELELSLTKPITASGILTIKDKAGNIAEYNLITDQTAPTLNQLKMTKDNGLMITVSEKLNKENSYLILSYDEQIYSDDIATSQKIDTKYLFSELTMDTTEVVFYVPVEKNKEYSISFYLEDVHSNIQEVPTETFDTMGPVKSSKSPVDGGYYSSMAGLELASASGDSVTVYVRQYLTSTWSSYSEFTNFTDLLSGFNECKIQWYIEDSFGNSSPEYVFVYDATNPVVNNDIIIGSDKTNVGTLYSGNLTISIPTAIDSGSGIKKQRYEILVDGVPYLDGFISSDLSVTIPDEISGEISIVATYENNAGSETIKDMNIVLDNIKPIVEVYSSLVLKGSNQYTTLSKSISKVNYKTRNYTWNSSSNKWTYTDSKMTEKNLAASAELVNIKEYINNENTWYIFQFEDLLGNKTEEIFVYVYEDLSSFISSFNFSSGISCSSGICQMVDYSNEVITITPNANFKNGLTAEETLEDAFDFYYLWSTTMGNNPNTVRKVYSGPDTFEIKMFDNTNIIANQNYYWHLGFSLGENKVSFDYSSSFKQIKSVSFNNYDYLLGGILACGQAVDGECEKTFDLSEVIADLGTGTKAQMAFYSDKLDKRETLRSLSYGQSIPNDSGYLHVLFTLNGGQEIYFVSPNQYYLASLSKYVFAVNSNGEAVGTNYINVDSDYRVVSDAIFYYHFSGGISSSKSYKIKLTSGTTTSTYPTTVSTDGGHTIVKSNPILMEGKILASGVETLSLELVNADGTSLGDDLTYKHTIHVNDYSSSSILTLKLNSYTSSGTTIESGKWYQGNLNFYVVWKTLDIKQVRYAIISEEELKNLGYADYNNVDVSSLISEINNFSDISYSISSAKYANFNVSLTAAKYKVIVKATDSDYNEYVLVNNLFVDEKIPNITSVTTTGIKNNGHINADSVGISFVATDVDSGVKEKTCTINNSIFTCNIVGNTATIAFDKTNTIEVEALVTIKVTDNAGNYAILERIIYLDLKAPVVNDIEVYQDADSSSLIRIDFVVSDSFSDFDVYFQKGQTDLVSNIDKTANKLGCKNICSAKIANSENDIYTIYVEDYDGNGSFYHVNLKLPTQVSYEIVADNKNIIYKNSKYYTNGQLKLRFGNVEDLGNLSYYFSQDLKKWSKITTVSSDIYSFNFETKNLTEGDKQWYIKVVTGAGLSAILSLEGIYFDNNGPVSGPTSDSDSAVILYGKNKVGSGFGGRTALNEQFSIRCNPDLSICYFNYDVLEYKVELNKIADSGVGVDFNSESAKIVIKSKNENKILSEHYFVNYTGDISGEIKLSSTDTLTAESSYIMYVYTYDLLGNENIKELDLEIDRTSDTIKNFNYFNDWIRSPLEVTFDITEIKDTPQSPIAAVTYWLCGANQSCTKPTSSFYNAEKIEDLTVFLKSITSNGYWNIEITDKAGNTSINTDLKIENIDDNLPIICKKEDCDASVDSDYFSYSVNVSYDDSSKNILKWVNRDVVVTFEEYNMTNLSPNFIQWKKAGDSYWTFGSKNDGKIILTFAEEKSFTIVFRAIDKATLNSGMMLGSDEIELTIQIDKTAPNLGQIEGYEMNSWTNKNVDLTIGVATDNLSGLKDVYYQINGGVYISYGIASTQKIENFFTCEYERVCVYQLRQKASDIAGNEIISEIMYVKIDKQLPTLGHIEAFKENGDEYNSSSTWVKENITIRVYGGNDGLDCSSNKCSDVKLNSISFDGGETWEPYQELNASGYYEIILNRQTVNYIIKIKIEDNAGNSVEDLEVFIIKSDWSAPEVTPKYQIEEGKEFVKLDIDKAKWYNKSVKVTLNIEDYQSGMQAATIKVLHTYDTEFTSLCVWNWKGSNDCTDKIVFVEDLLSAEHIRIMITFQEDGYYKLSFNIRDNLANEYKSDSVEVKIDKNTNTDKFYSGEVTYSSGSLDSSIWYNDTSDFPSYIRNAEDIFDSLSGISTVELTYNGKDFSSVGFVGFEGALPTQDGIHSIYFRVTDHAGNVSYSSKVEYKIDTTKPTIDTGASTLIEAPTCVDCLIEQNNGITYLAKIGDNFKVSVVVNYNGILDEYKGTGSSMVLPVVSGINKIEYAKVEGNGREWYDLNWAEGKSKGIIEIDEAGMYIISIRVTDGAGNQSFVDNQVTLNVLTDRPNIESISFNGVEHIEGENYWYQNAAQYVITIKTNQAVGIRFKYEYVTKNSEYSNPTSTNRSNITLKDVEDKEIKLRLMAYMALGDQEYASEWNYYTFGIDNPDNLLVEFDYNDESQKPTNQNVNVTSTISGSESGISSAKYVISEGVNYSDLTFEKELELTNDNTQFEIIIEQKGNYVFEIIDNAGNIIYKELKVTKIDKEKPQVNIMLDNETYQQNHNITVQIIESSIYKLKYYVDSNSEYSEERFDECEELTEFNASNLVFDETGIYYLHIMVKDEAGNESNPQTSSEIYIDKTVPTVENLEGVSASWFNENVTITIPDGYDQHSGFAGYEYSLDKGNSWISYNKVTGIVLTETEIYELQYRSKDFAGNYNNGTTINFGIDKNNPVIDSVIAQHEIEDIVKEATITYTVNITSSISGIESIKVIKIDEDSFVNQNLGLEDFALGEDVSLDSKQFIVSNSGYYSVIAISKSHLFDTYYLEVKWIDNRRPDITFENISDAWSKDYSEVSVSIEDNTDENNVSSGINQDQIYYFVSDQIFNDNELTIDQFKSQNKGSSNFVIEEIPLTSGEFYIYVYAIDNAGNEKIQKSSGIKIDRSTPSAPDIQIYYESDQVEIELDKWIKGPVNIKLIDPTTSYSGIKLRYYKLYKVGEEAEFILYESSNEIVTTINETGKYVLEAYVVNEVDTQSEILIKNIWVDMDKPLVGNVLVNGESEVLAWYQQFTLTVSAGMDNSSGYKHTYYKWYNDDVVIEEGVYSSELSISSNGLHKVEIYAIDNVGNVSDSQIFEFGIDEEKDTVTFDYNSKLTNQPLIIGVTIDNQISMITEFSYIISDSILTLETFSHESSIKIESNQIIISENGIVNVYIKDASNNENIMHCEITNIDLLPPSFTLELDNDLYQQMHTININLEEDITNISAIKYYFDRSPDTPRLESFKGVNEKVTQIVTPDTLETGNWYAHILVIDLAGNPTIKNSEVVKIDKTAPLNGGTTVKHNNWYLEVDVNILEGTDQDSGFDGVWYLLENLSNPATVDWVKYTETISVNEEGNYKLSYYSKDKAGNISSTKIVNFGIDQSNPVINEIIMDDKFTNRPVSVLIDAVDNLSGIKNVEYKLKSSDTFVTVSLIDNKYLININENGVYEVKVTDNVGKSVSEEFSVNQLDQKSPYVTISVNTSEWQLLTNVRTSVIASDQTGGLNAVSGISHLRYCWSTLNLTVSEENFENVCSSYNEIKVDDDSNHSIDSKKIEADLITPSESGTYYIYMLAFDNAGNMSMAETKVIRIDNTKPNIPTINAIANQLSLSSGDVVNTEVTVNITMNTTDNTSGLSHFEYRINDGEWTPYQVLKLSAEQEYKIEAIAVDNVGLISEISTMNFVIDLTKPTLTESTAKDKYNNLYNFGTWTNRDVIVTLSSGEDTYQIAKTEYRLDKTIWKNKDSNSLSITAEGQHILEIRTTDKAGNVSDIKIYEIWIDKTNPLVGAPLLVPNTLIHTTAPTLEAGVGKDSLSGFKEYQYQIYQNENLYSDWSLLDDNVELPSESVDIYTYYQIKIKAYDNAGNSSGESSLFYTIVKEGFVLELKAETTEYTNKDINVEVVLNDTIKAYLSDKTFTLEYVKGVSLEGLTLDSYDLVYSSLATQIKADKGKFNFNANSNGNYVVVLKILEGSIYKSSMLQAISISNIDKEAPSINITVPTNEWVYESDPIKVIISESSTFSGIKTITYQWYGSNQTPVVINVSERLLHKVIEIEAPSVSGSYYLIVEVEDYANNTRTENSSFVQIDRSAPENGVLSITPANKEIHNNYYDLTVSNSTNDFGSGFSHYNYRLLRKVNGTWAYVMYDSNSESYLEINDSWSKMVSFVRIQAISGEYKVQFVAVDKIGNIQTEILESKVLRIDKEIPTIDIKCNNQECLNSWYNQAVTLSFNAFDELSGIEKIQYRIGSGDWNDVTKDLVIDKEGRTNLKVRSMDKAGNASEVKEINVQVDTQQDIVNVNLNSISWSNKETKVYLSIQGVKSPTKELDVYFEGIRLNVLSDEKGYYFLLNDNGNLKVVYMDEATNVTETTATVSIFDRINPILNLSDYNQMYAKSHTIEVTASDANSGLGTITYVWDNGETQIDGYISKCVASKECTDTIVTPQISGSWILTVIANDRAGNIDVSEERTYFIDVTSPTPATAIWSMASNIVNSYEGYFTVVTGSDIHSGIASNMYQILKDNQVVVDWTVCDNGTTIDLPNQDGTYKLIIKTIDKVGLESENEYSITIDTVQDSIDLSTNISSWTNKDITITINVDSISDIVKYGYLEGEKSLQDFQGSFNTLDTNKLICTKNGIYTIYVLDAAGNESVKTIEITNIDKEYAIVHNEVDSEIKKNFTFDILIEDIDGSGIKTISYNWKKGEENINYVTKTNINSNSYLLESVTTPNKSGVWTLVITVTDMADNKKTYEYDGYKVDLTGPTITGMFDHLNKLISNNSWFAETLTITEIVCLDNFSTENKIYYRFNLNEEWKLYESEQINFDEEGQFSIYLKAVDSFGNEGIETTFVFYVDKTAPVIEASNAVIPFGGVFEHNYEVSDNMDSDIASKVEITGNVNSDVAGEYEITYKATDLAGHVGFKTIKVIVKTEIVPIITIDVSDVIIEVHSDYELPYATVNDNGTTTIIAGVSDFNPDILGTYIVTYSYQNQAGQTAGATKRIIVKDTTAPVFDFSNLNKEIVKGNKFTSEYVVAIDNYDQEVTYTVQGEVNTSKVGKYELVFTAKDSSNNVTTETIVIEVVRDKFEFNAVTFVEIAVIAMLVAVLGSFVVRYIKKKKLAD